MASQLLERPSTIDAPDSGQTGAEFVRYYRSLVSLDDADLADALQRAHAAEVAAEPDERRLRVMARLRACAEMHKGDARRFSAANESVYACLPTRQRKLIEETERDAAMNGLRLDEFERIRQYVPSLRDWDAPERPRHSRLDRLTAILAALETDMAFL